MRLNFGATIFITTILAFGTTYGADRCDFSAYQPLRFVPEGKTIRRSVVPEYPKDASDRGIQGLVNVRVLFDANGIVQKACAISGDPLLRAAAESAALKTLFEPVLLNEKPVPYVELQISFNFVLPNDSKGMQRDFSWRTVNRCGATLSIPADMIAPHAGELGLDECIELFENQSIQIEIETDPFPFAASNTKMNNFSQFELRPEFSRVQLILGSSKAILVRYFDAKDRLPYKAAMSVTTKTGLRLSSSMRRQEDWEAVQAIFLSITVKNPLPNGSFELNVGGMPGSDRFAVQLKTDHTLTVTKESLPITEKGLTKKSFKRVLDKEDATQLEALASRADDFGLGCNAVADGTNAKLLVRQASRMFRASCAGATSWPSGSKTKTFISILNSYLPDDLRIF
jgi:hypothetical protein